MDDNLNTNQEVKAKVNILQKLKNMNRKKLILFIILGLLVIAAGVYALFMFKDKAEESSKKKEEEKKEIDNNGISFRGECYFKTKSEDDHPLPVNHYSIQNGDELQCIFGYDSSENHEVTSVTGDIDLGPGFDIIKTEAPDNWNLKIEDNLTFTSTFSEPSGSKRDELIIINVSVNDNYLEDFHDILINNITAKTDKKSYYFPPFSFFSILGESSNYSIVEEKYEDDPGRTYYYSYNSDNLSSKCDSTINENCPSQKTLFEFHWANKYCHIEFSNSNNKDYSDGDRILVSDASTIVEYYFLTGEKKDILVSKDKNFANAIYSIDNNGIIISFNDGSYNYYSLKDKKFIFNKNISEVYNLDGYPESNMNGYIGIKDCQNNECYFSIINDVTYEYLKKDFKIINDPDYTTYLKAFKSIDGYLFVIVYDYGYSTHFLDDSDNIFAESGDFGFSRNEEGDVENIIVSNGSEFELYTSKGKLLRKSKKYYKESIRLLDYNNIVVIEDGYYRMVDNKGVKIADFCKKQDTMEMPHYGGIGVNDTASEFSLKINDSAITLKEYNEANPEDTVSQEAFNKMIINDSGGTGCVGYEYTYNINKKTVVKTGPIISNCE